MAPPLEDCPRRRPRAYKSQNSEIHLAQYLVEFDAVNCVNAPLKFFDRVIWACIPKLSHVTTSCKFVFISMIRNAGQDVLGIDRIERFRITDHLALWSVRVKAVIFRRPSHDFLVITDRENIFAVRCKHYSSDKATIVTFENSGTLLFREIPKTYFSISGARCNSGMKTIQRQTSSSSLSHLKLSI